MSPASTVAVHQPIFLVGCPRSGTTLLRALLTTHPRIAIPPETHFIPQLIARFGTGSMHPPVRDQALAFLRRHPRFPHGLVSWNDLRAQVVARGSITAAVLLHTFYALYAQREGGKSRWGDKTPSYVLHIPLLAQLFPQAQFLHIIRDGRDIALSISEKLWGGGSAVYAAALWQAYVTQARITGSRLPRTQYQEVRYEDLVATPRAVLQDLCAFLGEEFDERMLDFRQQRIPELRPDLLAPVGSQHVGVWREGVTVPIQQDLEYSIGPFLRDLGYRTEHGQPPPWRRARLRISVRAIQAAVFLVQLFSLRWQLRVRRVAALAVSWRVALVSRRVWLFPGGWVPSPQDVTLHAPKVVHTHASEDRSAVHCARATVSEPRLQSRGCGDMAARDGG